MPFSRIGLRAFHEPRGGAHEALGGVINIESMGLDRGLRDQPDAIVIEHVEQGDETPRLVAQIGSQHEDLLYHQHVIVVRDAR